MATTVSAQLMTLNTRVPRWPAGYRSLKQVTKQLVKWNYPSRGCTHGHHQITFEKLTFNFNFSIRQLCSSIAPNKIEQHKLNKWTLQLCPNLQPLGTVTVTSHFELLSTEQSYFKPVTNAPIATVNEVGMGAQTLGSFRWLIRSRLLSLRLTRQSIELRHIKGHSNILNAPWRS